MQVSVPILYQAYNRPTLTKISFGKLREVRPRRLFIFLDGPDPDIPSDKLKTDAVREVVHQIDWPCQVAYNIQKRRLGPHYASGAAIDWFFSKVPMGIILEDDVIVHPTFYPFCESLLRRYKKDLRIMQISAYTFGYKSEASTSYYFSRLPHVWGWATWRRAWKKYDVTITHWPQWKKQKVLDAVFPHTQDRKFWEQEFDGIFSKKLNRIWDYQWYLSMWADDGYAIVPSVNLVRNIGFGPEATHTTDPDEVSVRTLRAMKFPLIHPDMVSPDRIAEAYVQKHHFSLTREDIGSKNVFSRIYRKLLSII